MIDTDERGSVMSHTGTGDSEKNQDDEMTDAQKAVASQPFVDTHGELDDSADSYVSPARDDESAQ
jgi:hypothetical protein